MKNRSHTGRYAALSSVFICIGLSISGCTGDEDGEAAAGDAKVSSAADTPDKPEAIAAKTPEPSLYTETIYKIKNGTTLPPNVASSASACPRDKVQYKNSGHRLASPFEG